MKILLIDADSTIPNLALMKLSTYHKELGHEVELVQLNLPYYPGRKKRVYYPKEYDAAYCSTIYDNSEYIVADSNKFVAGSSIIFGGTGYSLTKELDPRVEQLQPDYSIYPSNDTSYGFITRGCIRKCSFCVVPEKEGNIRQVSTVNNIVSHKKVHFLDNNILAFSKHENILAELIDKKIKCCFNQGLDIRLVNNENSVLLSKLKYIGAYTYAFDDIKLESLIQDKLKLMGWRNDWCTRFFIYVHPDINIPSITYRIEWCRRNKCLPYIMRDLECWGSVNSDFYVDIASWCNQPGLFKNLLFDDFLERRHVGKRAMERISRSSKLYSIRCI